jgi:CDP-glucose 4,6-dehydratase
MDRDFTALKDSKVLVTGATGFIGSWLTESLVEVGAKVTILVKKDDPIGLDSIRHLTKSLKVVYGDIRNSAVSEELVKNQDIVYHLAAETQVIHCIKWPKEAFEVNTLGTLNILEAIRKVGNGVHLIHVSTDKVFGEPKYLPIDENHPFDPDSPYEVSKLAAERFVNSYHSTYGLPTTIVRWSNTIGGRDTNYLRIVPSIIWPLLEERAPIIRGDGSHIRDYMYVDDVSRCLLLLAKNRAQVNGDDFNVGTGKPTSVIELTKLIVNLMGYEGKIEPIVQSKPTKGEINSQYLSSSKIRSKLGFQTNFDLVSGLQLTIDWHRKNLWWREILDRVERYYENSN